VNIAIRGVTVTLPHAGHCTLAAPRSAAVSTTSKLFLQVSHMNSYVGIGSSRVSARPCGPSEQSLGLHFLRGGASFSPGRLLGRKSPPRRDSSVRDRLGHVELLASHGERRRLPRAAEHPWRARAAAWAGPCRAGRGHGRASPGPRRGRRGRRNGVTGP
jgi:hypothetical protein